MFIIDRGHVVELDLLKQMTLLTLNPRIYLRQDSMGLGEISHSRESRKEELPRGGRSRLKVMCPVFLPCLSVIKVIAPPQRPSEKGFKE